MIRSWTSSLKYNKYVEKSNIITEEANIIVFANNVALTVCTHYQDLEGKYKTNKGDYYTIIFHSNEGTTNWKIIPKKCVKVMHNEDRVDERSESGTLPRKIDKTSE